MERKRRYFGEYALITLALIVLVVGLTLAVLLYVGSLFFQGYIYTEPTEGLLWRAPVAAAGLTIFLFIWCWLIARTPGASPQDIPYDTVFRFSPRVDMMREPVKEIWAIKKNEEQVPYWLTRPEPNRYAYLDKRKMAWRREGVVKIMFVHEREKLNFNLAPVKEGGYREFVSDSGWVLREYDNGPTGIPSIFRWSRFLMTLVLNFLFFLLWFAVLWLIIRFQWAHALGFAIILWLTFTLALLPMILTTAAQNAPRL